MFYVRSSHWSSISSSSLFVIIWLDNKARSVLKIAQQCAIKSKTKTIIHIIHTKVIYASSEINPYSRHCAWTMITAARYRLQCYRRHRVSNGDSHVLFFSPPYSVKTTSLPHTPNNLFDHIWRKGVPFGSLVQKFSTPTLQPPKFKICHSKMRFFVKIAHLL